MEHEGARNTVHKLFENCGVLSLKEGFRAFEESKDRSSNWRFQSFGEAAVKEFRSNGFDLTSVLNFVSYLRSRRRGQTDPVEIMRASFQRDLSAGQIEAIGHELHVPEGGGQPYRREEDLPVLIPREVWAHGVLDWGRAEVTGTGFAFTYVRILMPFNSWLVRDHSYQIDPLPELRPFRHSDERLAFLGLSAGSPQVEARDNGPKPKRGRRTRKAEIIQAYHEIEKNPDLTRNQLAHEVRVRSKEILGQNTDDGLSDDTILGHVGSLWDDFRNGNPEN